MGTRAVSESVVLGAESAVGTCRELPHDSGMTTVGRNAVALGRVLVFVIGVLLFLCFTSVDVQMRSYHHGESEIGTTKRDAVSLGEDDLRLPNASEISQARRRLSFHSDYLMSEWQDQDDNYGVRTQFSPASVDAEKDLGDAGTNTVERRLPYAIIIGVKKGGTRALLEILRLHPDVRAPGPEPHFFDRYFHKGLQWYRKQMPLSLGSQLTMEKTPSYFVTPEVPSRIHATLPDVKLLVVVRDPFTRAVSDYTQASSKRLMDTRTFEEMAFQNSTTGLVDTNWSAIKIGVYARHLQRWLAYFPLSQFHFVSGERLITDPVAELDSVQTFLGLRHVISSYHFFFNQTKGFPCLRRSPHSTVPHCLGKTKGRSHPRIPPSAEQGLRDFYRPFNQKFYRMVGRNFRWS